jgi:hypothetical protein
MFVTESRMTRRWFLALVRTVCSAAVPCLALITMRGMRTLTWALRIWSIPTDPEHWARNMFERYRSIQQTESDEELRETLSSQRRVTRRDGQMPARQRRELPEMFDLIEHELLGI